MRVLAISDLHLDFPGNDLWFQQVLSAAEGGDALIIAGDIAGDLAKLDRCLSDCRRKFAHVFYVPGNHELWIQRYEYSHSLQKLEKIIELCSSLGIKMAPYKLGTEDVSPLWIVPLFSWYAQPEDTDRSLYFEVPDDPGFEAWADQYFVRWPAGERSAAPADYFLALNHTALARAYDAPVISFSHFLPRRELIYAGSTEAGRKPPVRSMPVFNFSRVAGDAGLEDQIRKLGARLHVYGHQHRNRRRELDGITYLSHCLGYPYERERGWVTGVEAGPCVIWNTLNDVGRS